MNRRPTGQWLWCGFAFGAVGAVVSFHQLARSTAHHLLSHNGRFSIYEAFPASLPIPRMLVLPGWLIDRIEIVAGISAGVAMLIGLALYGFMAWVALQTLNPTARLTVGPGPFRIRDFFSTFMDSRPITKLLLLAVSSSVVVGMLWLLLGAVLPSEVSASLLQFVLSGAIAFYLFSRDGVAGDCTTLNIAPLPDRATAALLLSRGCLAGCFVFAAWQFMPFQGPVVLFNYYQSLSYIGFVQWEWIAFTFLGINTLLWFSVGLAIAALGLPLSAPKQRIELTALPLILLALVLVYGRLDLPSTWRYRHDYRIGLDPNETVQMLSQRAQLRNTAPAQRVLFVGGLNPPGAVEVWEQSIVGVTASTENQRRLLRFLRDRNFQSSLNFVALEHLFDSAALHWDVSGMMMVDLISLEHCPYPIFLNLLIEELQNCAATPVNLRALDQLADTHRFQISDRRAELLIADLYEKFGARNRAMSWYRRAGLSQMRLQQIASQPPAFTDGVISGRVLVNNHPGGNCEVGVMPISALAELKSGAEMLAPGRIRPFWMRWLAAATQTSANGGFQIDHLRPGRYILVVCDNRIQPGADGVLPQLAKKIAPIDVSATAPKSDIGKIEITAPPGTLKMPVPILASASY